MTSKTIIQNHHISYDPEIKALVYKGEHHLLTRLSWRKKISKGFIKSLKVWMVLNEDKAIEVKR